MGYLHIDNLYKNTKILEFKRCYALEKIHGTSAHISWRDGQLSFFSGEQKDRFPEIFDHDRLRNGFVEMDHERVTVYGECYGGKVQGMKETYGEQLRFVCFDVKIGEAWLDVPKAHTVSSKLGLEFVDYIETNSDIDALNAERDRDSVQAIRNGMGAGKKREGVVLRPPFESIMNNGKRVIAKHKRDDFRETKLKRVVGVDREVLIRAREIAEEWVTPMRMSHVLQKMPEATGIEHTGAVISAMLNDIEREAEGEIVMSKAAKKEIAASTAKMWKRRISRI